MPQEKLVSYGFSAPQAVSPAKPHQLRKPFLIAYQPLEAVPFDKQHSSDVEKSLTLHTT